MLEQALEMIRENPILHLGFAQLLVDLGYFVLKVMNLRFV